MKQKKKQKNLRFNIGVNMKSPSMGSSCMHPLSMSEYYMYIKKQFRNEQRKITRDSKGIGK